jgi:uncharacterized protein YqgC (DUF456 family)
LNATVARLSSTNDLGGGKAAGQAALWALIVGGLGLLFGLGSVVALFLKLGR